MTRQELDVLVDALRWRELEDAAGDWRTWATVAVTVAGMFAALFVSAIIVAAL